MPLSDFISSPFLLYLGITLAIIGAVSVFFIHRLNDQNHKIVSMLGLVSTMAEELSFVRSKLQISPQNSIPNSNSNHSTFSGGNQHTTVNKLQNDTQLIDVSDDDSSSDDSSNDDFSSDDSSNDESSNDESSSDDSSNSGDESSVDDNKNNSDSDKESSNCTINDSSLGDSSNGNMSVGAIKSVIKNDIKLINITQQDTTKSFENSLDMVLVDETDDSNNEGVVLDEQLEMGTENIAHILNSVKLIKVTEDENYGGDNVLSLNDYKKMPIQKLKSLVVERGLASTVDVSKMKKNDLVKLLETLNTSPNTLIHTQISCLSLNDIDGNLADNLQ